MARKKDKGQESVTLDEFIARVYLPHIRNRKRSWRHDEAIIGKHISPFFGERKLGEIQFGEVVDWHDGLLAAGFAPGSCNIFLSIFKKICAVAESRGILKSGTSPCRGIQNFKVGEPRTRYLTREEGERLMEALTRSADIRAKALQLILLTGARKNEILKASWEWVDFDAQILTVPVSKSNKPRHIVLSDEAVRILKGLDRSHKWIFPGRDPGKPVSDIFTFWNGVRIELGFPDVRIHDLRHTFASYLVNNGHSLYEVQRLLGHAGAATTMRYAHLESRSLKSAVNDVGKILNRTTAA